MPSSKLKNLPFDGAISKFYKSEAPKAIREALKGARKRDVLSPSFPYQRWMKKAEYETELKALQVELVKLQHWIAETGQRAVVIFEGRDTAGKGGAISRITQVTNPRVVHVEALPKPTERQMTQWYFQRYVERLPAAGEVVLFDRSWYNRAVVEPVFGFCTAEQRERFFVQAPHFETMLVEDGVRLIKLWLNIGRAEQLRRMLARESDMMKQWKLSSIDVKGLHKWDDYTTAIAEMFKRTHHKDAPWTIIRAEDKYRARISVIRKLLSAFDYERKNHEVALAPDDSICGGPEVWDPS